MVIISSNTIAELKKSISQLRREADDQLSLEFESQQNFEFLSSQVRALRHAFGTLSDVVVEEIEVLRNDHELRLGEVQDSLAKALHRTNVVHSEVALLR